MYCACGAGATAESECQQLGQLRRYETLENAATGGHVRVQATGAVAVHVQRIPDGIEIADEDASNKADSLYSKIKDGGSFTVLAKENSDDRFNYYCLYSHMGQANRWVLPGTSTTKVLSAQHDIPYPDFF